MKNIDKYKKQNSVKLACKVASVNIEVKQHEFVLANRLNLSEMVRDMLAEYMGKPKASKSA